MNTLILISGGIVLTGAVSLYLYYILHHNKDVVLNDVNDDVILGVENTSVESIVERLNEQFYKAYPDYINKKEICDKLNKAQSIWIKSSEDDPVAKKSIRDIKITLNIAQKQLEDDYDILTNMISEIYDNAEILAYIRSHNFQLYRDSNNWRRSELKS